MFTTGKDILTLCAEKVKISNKGSEEAMFSYESLEWAMGFQWPVIGVFIVLLAIGIGRMMTWGAEEESVVTDTSFAGTQKKGPAAARSAGKLARTAGHLMISVHVRPKLAGSMRHHAVRHRPMNAVRSKQG